MSELRRLLKIREEARETWDNLASDEVVYLLKDVDGQGEGTVWHLDEYARGALWLELFLRLSSNGVDGDYVALLDADVDHATCANGQTTREGNTDRENREVAMLIGVAEGGQYPQAIPSVIRLKPFNLLSSLWFDVLGETKKLAKVGLLEEREHDVSGGFPSEMLHGQLVCNMVKSGTHVVNGISNNQPPLGDVRGSKRGLLRDIASSLRIVLKADGLIIALVETPNITIEKLQVALRPLYLEPRAVKWMAHAESIHHGAPEPSLRLPMPSPEGLSGTRDNEQ